ncbi:thiopurine S-methyltransferase [Cognatazoarcus halotolerans]|uniref:thiopurine S-methyltransferase n=1 Tax=Cognatazoarcus halotolerans TaxID=2686016 RepID=UPI001357068F|nr:thiopurine S-methyltransferase [Cognatazoarcus halotolerans]MCB1900687.1 thiopurine S-methyltransferase [Rhodocyclaceae bacterium]MCP5309490.1 thiopurine S-methyltransferase [Zoogloeaceae bacterium]
MDAEFWHRKWAREEIGFHENEVNPLLIEHFVELAQEQDSRIFLPLCGKTLDIHWLLSEGYRVVGVELSRSAVEQLFDELGVEPAVSSRGPFEWFSGPGVDIFVGDFFELSSAILGRVDAIYDRAALVALPPAMRERYAARLVDITAHAPQLLICFEYDQALMNGPPFAVEGAEVARHYEGCYRLRQLGHVEIPGGFKGRIPAAERVWLLQAGALGSVQTPNGQPGQPA